MEEPLSEESVGVFEGKKKEQVLMYERGESINERRSVIFLEKCIWKKPFEKVELDCIEEETVQQEEREERNRVLEKRQRDIGWESDNGLYRPLVDNDLDELEGRIVEQEKYLKRFQQLNQELEAFGVKLQIRKFRSIQAILKILLKSSSTKRVS